MPLNRAVLATAILNAFQAAKAIEDPEAQPPAEETLANALADAIDAYVRGGVVTGVQVSVTVSATTSTVSGHAHTVNRTATGTQSNSVGLA